MVGVDLDSLRQALVKYSQTYLGDRLLELSGKCDLHLSWRLNQTFENATAQGCYFLCDEETVLYIGKASMGNSIGARVSSHFVWNGHELFPVKANWIPTPIYLRTLVVSPAWEAASLEEYLIHHLNPPFNVAGRSKP